MGRGRRNSSSSSSSSSRRSVLVVVAKKIKIDKLEDKALHSATLMKFANRSDEVEPLQASSSSINSSSSRSSPSSIGSTI